MGLDCILLDMDGVLADFNSAALRAHGRDPTTTKVDRWHLEEILGVSCNEFWRVIDRDIFFWDRLEPYEGIREWVEELRSIAPVVIATSPPRNPTACAAKVRWLYEHVGDWVVGNLMIGSRKELMARHDRILIDDKPENCERFARQTGWSHLFYQPWNCRASGSPQDIPASQRQALEGCAHLRSRLESQA